MQSRDGLVAREDDGAARGGEQRGYSDTMIVPWAPKESPSYRVGSLKHLTGKIGSVDTAVDALFELTPAVRYVAFYQDGELFMHKRPGIGKATASESDHYEELLVNPAILTLADKRGNIDCGGL